MTGKRTPTPPRGSNRITPPPGRIRRLDAPPDQPNPASTAQGAHRSTPLELRWDSTHCPLTPRWVVPGGRKVTLPQPGRNPLDFCGRMRRVCEDVAARCPALAHLQMPAILLSFTPSRNRSPYGLQARVTPLRFRNGETVRRHGSVEYQVQRFYVDDVEMLYVVTFCLPRFLEQTFEEKLITVFHELYHISPEFDGDLRRHPGRYTVHSHSKECYDQEMAVLVKQYLAGHPEPEVFDFLRYGYQELWDKHRGVTGVVVPRPKLLPVGWPSTQAAQDR